MLVSTGVVFTKLDFDKICQIKYSAVVQTRKRMLVAFWGHVPNTLYFSFTSVNLTLGIGRLRRGSLFTLVA